AAAASHTVKEWNTGTIKLGSGSWDSGFVVEGQITLGATYSAVTFAQNDSGDTITRNDGGSWLADGFAAGQTISLAGAVSAQNHANSLLTAVTATTLTLSVADTVIAEGPESVRITADIGTVRERTADTVTLIELKPAFLALLGGAGPTTLANRTVVQRNRLGQNTDFF